MKHKNNRYRSADTHTEAARMPWRAVAVCLLLAMLLPVGACKPARNAPEGTEPEGPIVLPSEELPPINRCPLYPLPVYENTKYTAKEFAKKFSPVYDGIPTRDYDEVVLPSLDVLGEPELPTDELLPIKKQTITRQEPTKAELEAFLEDCVPRLAEALNEPLPEYQIKKSDFPFMLDIPPEMIYFEQHYATLPFQGYSTIQIDQGLSSLRVSLSSHETGGSLFGIPVTIRADHTDEEILTSLSALTPKLAYLFDMTITNVTVSRAYSNIAPLGFSNITVRFLTDTKKSLQIRFKCDGNDPVLTNHYIHFEQNSRTVENETVDTQRRISLEDAELLLYNGCVMGAHVCDICMKSQKGVDFEGYDYVTLEYKSLRLPITSLSTLETESYPFYAFYKKIKTLENGNSVYAKTYVCAFELGDYVGFWNSLVDEHIAMLPDAV